MLCTLQLWMSIFTTSIMVTALDIYYNSVLTTGCELGRPLYSPHFIDEEPEAQRGPWNCLKPQTPLSVHSLWLSRHEQIVPCGSWLCAPVTMERTPARLGLMASSSAQPCVPSPVASPGAYSQD